MNIRDGRRDKKARDDGSNMKEGYEDDAGKQREERKRATRRKPVASDFTTEELHQRASIQTVSQHSMRNQTLNISGRFLLTWQVLLASTGASVGLTNRAL